MTGGHKTAYKIFVRKPKENVQVKKLKHGGGGEMIKLRRSFKMYAGTKFKYNWNTKFL
jgi:hypothetical protein